MRGLRRGGAADLQEGLEMGRCYVNRCTVIDTHIIVIYIYIYIYAHIVYTYIYIYI